MPGTLAWLQPGLGDTCQSGKTATPLNSLFFAFNISLCVKYYDYIVKWCGGIACSRCVSLVIGLILALIVHLYYNSL